MGTGYWLWAMGSVFQWTPSSRVLGWIRFGVAGHRRVGCIACVVSALRGVGMGVIYKVISDSVVVFVVEFLFFF